MEHLRRLYPGDMEFHVNKANRTVCPRRRDFNVPHRKYKDHLYGGKNGESMFECLEKKLTKENIRYRYQAYNADTLTPLVLVFQTPLMTRICHLVMILIYIGCRVVQERFGKLNQKYSVLEEGVPTLWSGGRSI